MSLRTLLVSCSIVALTSAAPAQAQFVAPGGAPQTSQPAAPSAGLVLLKNGQTLSGTVSPAGDYYLVVTDTAELQVRAADVEAVCRDLEEVLTRKRAVINDRSADDHLDLAQWCIDRELFGHAARELTEAYRIDDIHPRIALVERRLKAAMTPVRPIVPPPPKPKPAVDDAAVEAATRAVGPVALAEFTVRIQPLLMNYCATAGCHGPKPASSFHLERVYLSERNDPRAVRRNLYAALQFVDRQSPATSKLLTMPIAAHGGRSNPVFHVHNAEHYRQLSGWVQRVAGAGVTPPTAATPATAGMPPPAAGSPTTTTPHTLSQRMPLAPPGASPIAPAAPAAKPAVPNGTAAGSTPTVPAPAASLDPFDPDGFNRLRNESPTPQP